MRTFRSAVCGAAVLALAVGAAALAQRRPESILPPGFEEPAQPTPRATATTPGEIVEPLPRATATPTAEPSPTPSASPTVDQEMLAEYELPSFARRSLSEVGVAGPAQRALGPEAFRGADGVFLERLMRGFHGPLASRWMEITLRRALLARAETPARVNGADFAAERAWLLLRLGESVGARALVQAVDPENYTPKLYQVAMQAALATGDPAAWCPLADSAAARDGERGWVLAKPVCVSLSGVAGGATQLAAAARRAGVRGLDLLLAQKIAGSGGQGRQSVTIEWDQVDRLNAWRFGLATAAGTEIPDELYATVGPQVDGWRALSPAIPVAKRIAPAERAALRGVISSASLVDLVSTQDPSQDENAVESAEASDLRAAYSGASVDDRRTALARLWGIAEGQDKRPRYERLILTARAAAVMPVTAGDPDADWLVAAMLSAGFDREAKRWRGVVADGGDAWAMLLIAAPESRGVVPYATFGRYSGRGDAALKQRLLFAGLAGLGRMAPDDIERGARALDVKIGVENSWTRAIDRAARAGQGGTVALLAAIAMQTPAWRGVPPEALYRIVGALRATRQEQAARMIAAEALARI